MRVRGRGPRDRQPDGHGRTFTQLALDLDTAAMQIDAPFYDHQTEAGTWTVTDIMPAMEGVEEPLSVGIRNPDPAVADITNNFSFVAPQFEPHHPADVRILHCVG